MAAGTVLAVAAGLAVDANVQAHPSVPRPAVPAADAGIHKIKHIIIITQENRSFDSYFGTYPGADGIPKNTCTSNPRGKKCLKPFVDHLDSNLNEPHGHNGSVGDVDG